MLGRLSSSLAVASLAVSLFSWCSPVSAAIQPIGAVVATNGPFIAIQTDKSARSLTRGSEFYLGDRLWTGPRTKAQIRFSDGAIMTLRPDTEFSVDEYEFDAANAANNKSLFTLVKGGFRTLTGLITRLRPDSYKVKTTYAIVGVRGTTYETVIDSGLYVAAWQGTVSVGNEESELLLGFGQNFNYARVSSANSAPTGLLQTPPQLLETIDPRLQEALIVPIETRPVTGLLQDGLDARLTATELASLTHFGMATVPASRSGLSGPASDGSIASPIIFGTATDTVLREGGTGTLLTTNTSTPTVAWGAWNGGLLQPNPQDASDTVSIANPVFWVTLQPATSLPATGVVTYGPAGSSGAGVGSAGNANVSFVSATVNFGTANLTGTMQVRDPIHVWDASFTGKLSGSSFALPATGAIDSAPNTLQGSVNGALSGVPALGLGGMGGVFDFQQVGDPNLYVNGVFAAPVN